MNQQNDFQNNLQNMLSGFFQNQAPTSGTLSSNTIPNSKGEMKAITSRSGVSYEGPLIPNPKKVVEREIDETTDKDQTNFQGIDFEADTQVPLIIGRSFLRTAHALIDVYGEEITLRVNDEAVTFNLNQTTRYSSTYDDMSVNRIDVAREEYAQEMLGFSKNSSSGNPTSTSEPIISNSSPSLTPFEGREVAKANSSIEEPLKLELKDLPSHLEYAYLEGADKLPVIIAKDLKDDEKEALLKVLRVKEYQEKDKIGSKPDKNGKRGEAEKSQKQLQ
nr:reverse transcriptase domain-containing protein [Tanacetum cinerariifolium]